MLNQYQFNQPYQPITPHVFKEPEKLFPSGQPNSGNTAPNNNQTIRVIIHR